MVDLSEDSTGDLTSTIHISQLRPVPSSEISRIEDRLSSEEREIISQLSPASAMLIGLSGPGKGFRFLLDAAQTTIGREPENDISLDDVTVSRKHAKITSESGVFTLVDQKSLNGSYVNAHSISDQALKHGDEIQIGKFRFNFFQSNSGK